ncbi:hypothetical protein BDFG_02434 [Blastomyces dermatitidis ATCC 26199]|nr:hypothetical protein BDFG_02434 [Blastomyces dermatitidis ATCC 26199]
MLTPVLLHSSSLATLVPQFVCFILSEDSTVERFGLTTPPSTTTFRHRGATEKARRQIGVVTLHIGDGETTTSFLDDVETQACKLWKDSTSGSLTQVETGSDEMVQRVQDVLQSAALDAIHKREG